MELEVWLARSAAQSRIPVARSPSGPVTEVSICDRSHPLHLGFCAVALAREAFATADHMKDPEARATMLRG